MILIQSENLKNVVVALLEKGGSNAEEADTVASHLVRSNLCGHDSHGVGMMPLYMNKLGEGLLNPNQKPEKVKEDGSILMFEGNRGYGQSVAKRQWRRLWSFVKKKDLS